MAVKLPLLKGLRIFFPVTFMFDKGGSPPPAPDPAATAAAQGQANQEAARLTTQLNRADQYTPYGNLTWTQGGPDYNKAGYDAALKAWADAGGQGTKPVQADFGYNPDKWQSTITLDPRVQQLVDSNLKTSQGLQSAVNAALGQTTNTLSKPLNTPQGLTTEDLLNLEAHVDTRFPQLLSPLKSLGDRYLGTAAAVNDINNNLFNQIKTPFNYGNAPAMPTADQATRQSVEDALYRRATARLNPRFSQSQDQLNSTLAAQGITQGSEAYNRELQNFNMAKNDAYSSAMNDAITGADTAMKNQFDMGMAARQQGVNEANTLRTMPTQEALAANNILNNQGKTILDLLQANTNQNAVQSSSLLNDYNILNNNNQTNFGNSVTARNQILNELNALRTGAQANMPQFGNTNIGAQVAPAPIAQAIDNAYQGQLNNYNTQVGSNNSNISAAAGLGGTALMALMM